jgi:hypothetical protein
LSKRVFVTGGTGFVGSAIVRELAERGDHVVVLTRNADRARAKLGDSIEPVEGDSVCSGPWQEHVATCDAIVNLAGQPIADKRWNARYRQLIHDSRVETTRMLTEAVAAAPEADRPRVLVSASGIDYYPFDMELMAALGSDPSDDVTERSPPGEGVLARLCRHWEAEAREANALGVRVALMRMGVVLGPGGPLDKMAGPFKWFVGGRIGGGDQIISWVHLRDVVRAYLLAIDTEDMSGPYNVVAPGVATAAELARAIGKALKRPSWIPVPKFALRAAVGPFSEYLLNGRQAVPAALIARGFTFEHPDIEPAVADCFA